LTRLASLSGWARALSPLQTLAAPSGVEEPDLAAQAARREAAKIELRRRRQLLRVVGIKGQRPRQRVALCLEVFTLAGWAAGG
jgi:hypothetical protein